MKEWFTVQEVAEQLGTTDRKVQDAVRHLRRVGLVKTMPDPRDERYNLIHSSGVDAIKKALNLDTDSSIA